jgi:shikimate dehydrogenase
VTTPSATTRVAAVLGDPVRHSFSPVLHNAAFAALGLDWVYVALQVAHRDGVAAVNGARALGIDGLSITMPLKETVAGAVDRLSPTARRLGAVNAVVRDGAVLTGHNTDGGGFIDALRLDLDWTAEGRRCLVVGAGGAARAVVLALADAGAREVVVVNRTLERAAVAAALAGARGRVGEPADAERADLVVNATPVGMSGIKADGTVGAVAERLGGRGQVVVDLIYHPLVTPLLDEADRRGARTANGIGMLAHQAARAFELWTGEEAPRPVMVAALTAALNTVSGDADT